MEKCTQVPLVLLYVYRFYKRSFPNVNRAEFTADMCECRRILKSMKQFPNREPPIDSVKRLIDRINRWWDSSELHPTIRNSDCPDPEIVKWMLKITREIEWLLKCPCRHLVETQIIKRLMAIHNLPRVLLLNEPSDPTSSTAHMPKEDAIQAMRCYLSKK